MGRTAKEITWTGVRLLLVILIMTFLVFPFLVCLSNAFKMEGEINLLEPRLIPRNPSLDNVRELFADKNYTTGLKNSAVVALVTMGFALVIALPAAYVLARVNKRVAPVAQTWIILSQMIPVITLTVPLYLILRQLSLTDNLVGLVLVYTIWSIPTTLWLLRGFVGGFPKELEEAASIDGCGILGVFVRILIPNILPGIMTAGIFAFIGAWNEFFFALCFLKSPGNNTLSMTLYTYIGLAGQSRDGMLAAACLFSSIPGILLFAFFQRYYVSGLTDGAVK